MDGAGAAALGRIVRWMGRAGLLLVLLLGVCFFPPRPMAQEPPGERAAPPADPAGGGIDLLGLRPGMAYAQWLAAAGWADRRPFSDSTRRFRIEDGALRMESRGESFLIGRTLPPSLRRSPREYPYLRFRVRIGAVPAGARLAGERRDDAAFRIYAVFNDNPPQALVYVWSRELPVGAWSARGRGLFGDFRGVHRKAFGRGVPGAGANPDGWLLVEVNLLRDFRARFRGPAPRLLGVALKTDSNHTGGAASLAWVASATLHRASLRRAGYREGDRVNGAVLWFR